MPYEVGSALEIEGTPQFGPAYFPIKKSPNWKSGGTLIDNMTFEVHGKNAFI
jgi:hypothetical protein